MANKTQTTRNARFSLDRNAPLGRFWRWWSGELAALMPPWLQQGSGSAAHTLLVEISTGTIVLRRWIAGGLSEQGRLDIRAGDRASHGIAFQSLLAKVRKRDDQIALWLPAPDHLARQIDLPMAAQENLRQVLGFEMDRHTPFRADMVYYDSRIVQRDTQHKRLGVMLYAAPKAAVEASLDQLARLGSHAQAVYVAASPNGAGDTMVDLMPVERRVSRSSLLQRINLGLLALGLALGLAALAIPVWQKRQLTIAMIPIVERAKQQAAAADALRHEWDKRSAEYNFMLEKKQAAPPVVVQLDELSRLLPDDTWVQQFDFKGKEVQIQGETASASRLIALFDGAKLLRDASFRAPITKGITPNTERFHLAAEVKPLPAVATAPAPAVAPAPATIPAAIPVPAPAAVPPAAPLPADGKAEPGKVEAPRQALPVPKAPGQPPIKAVPANRGDPR